MALNTPRHLHCIVRSIKEGLLLNNVVHSNSISFDVLTEHKVATLWPKLEALSSDESWMGWSEEHYLKPLPQKWELSRLISVDSELVGFCLCSAKGGFLWVHRLVVDKDWRGRGLGALVLQELSRAITREGLLGIILKTPEVNLPARSFYKKNGFHEISTENGLVVMMLTSSSDIRVGIHQPNYLPWLGYFYKMSISNVFIFLDDADFPKGGYVNRNKICINGEASWLTVPSGGKYKTPIVDVYPAVGDWVSKHLRTLEVVYGRSPFFADYYPDIAAILSKNCSMNFADLNISLIKYISAQLEIDCILLRSSEMDVAGLSDVRLASLVAKVGGTTYISGAGGANYQSDAIYEQHDIDLVYSNFSPSPYLQNSSSFIAGLGVLDALFNIGAKGVTASFKQMALDR